MSEYVYILQNEFMPDIFKVGKTTNLEDRVRSLSSHTGVPIPFEIYYACKVTDSKKVEESIHNAFSDYRINPRREFFKINPERILPILKLVEIEEINSIQESYIDNEDIEIINRAKKVRSSFNFSKVRLTPGTKLQFIRDHSIEATIADNKNIEFEGSVISLTQATLKIFNEKLGKNWTSVQGPAYWEYEGETLVERRLRLEGDENDSSNKDGFVNYIYSSNKDGSHKADSYIKALEILSELLAHEPKGFSDCKNIWDVSSIQRIKALYEVVLEERKKLPDSSWKIDGIPESYLGSGFISAALISYHEYLETLN